MLVTDWRKYYRHFIIIIATTGCCLEKYQKYFALVKPLLDCLGFVNDVIVQTCQMAVFEIACVNIDDMILLKQYLVSVDVYVVPLLLLLQNMIISLQQHWKKSRKNSSKNTSETLQKHFRNTSRYYS